MSGSSAKAGACPISHVYKNDPRRKLRGRNLHCGYGSNYSGFPMRVTDTGFFMFFTDLDYGFRITGSFAFHKNRIIILTWFGLLNWTIGLV
jgi:hypothetical protein